MSNSKEGNVGIGLPLHAKYGQSYVSPSKNLYAIDPACSPVSRKKAAMIDEVLCYDNDKPRHQNRETEVSDGPLPYLENVNENDGHVIFKYQTNIGGDIRQQLLVQRAFNTHDDLHEPKASSPMRKIRVCTTATGIPTMTVSPSSGTLKSHGHNLDGGDGMNHHCQPYMMSQFMSPSSHAGPAHDIQSIFKTPIRNQRPNEDAHGVTPSHQGTPFMLSPASSASYGFTPGRQFVNPFEVDHDKLHMPIFSPNMFSVTSCAGNSRKEEGFWSVEHAALIMPVEIKEAEIRRQLRYQQKIDKEQDVKIQAAINKFFSNEVIVPSPWSEKVTHVLPRTPGGLRSISCQTTMSVPPNVDLFTELEGKYQLPDHKTEASPGSDLMINSFIRRKLLHQLNDNDSSLGSPSLPGRPMEEISSSPSPTKQTTPEWEKQTPNKIGPGHFSSSPIRHKADNRGSYHAMPEDEFLASPELSPIAGRGSKSMRSSGIYYSHQDTENPRTVMHLDFSSILDDPDEFQDETSDKTGTVTQKVASETYQDTESTTCNNDAMSVDHNHLTSAVSHDSDGNTNKSGGFSHRSLLTSATESNQDMLGSMPQSCFSQDTGYQTVSLQSTNQDSGSNSNFTSLETMPFLQSQHAPDSNAIQANFNTCPFAGIGKEFAIENKAEEYNFHRHKTELSMDKDGSFLGLVSLQTREKGKSADDIVAVKKNEACSIRKVRTLNDIRQSKVSRDLTHSFNEEKERSEISGSQCTAWSNRAAKNLHSRDADKHYPMQVGCSYGGEASSVVNTPVHNNMAHNPPDLFDVSMRSLSPYFNSSSERKGINNFNAQTCDERGCYDRSSTPYKQEPQSSHGSGCDDTLQAARLLLGKSVELRMKHSHKDTMKSDSGSDIENQAPEMCEYEMDSTSSLGRSETPPFKINPVDTSTPTSRAFTSLKKKIDKIEGGKLGSEIAAEILKRAGDDLAKLTNIIGKQSPSTSS
ncbi:unnamed protein product [Lymnaea stagnalis]|uniref:Protein aurora borealis n=1 Tax=Lymnaea stagnalis TaxID=6523 RepID=A0AAV2IN25_LYMST